MPYPRGSQWRRWDLHVHTPESFAWQAGDWDQYVNALERVEGVSVLGITDYFSIDGYKKILDYRKEGRLRNFDLILPNIEFRLSCLVPARGSADNPRRVNFHVVFSDEVPVEDIEEQFIHMLSFTYDGDTSGGESRSLTRRAIEGGADAFAKRERKLNLEG